MRRNQKHESSLDQANKSTYQKKQDSKTDNKTQNDKHNISNPLKDLKIEFGKPIDEPNIIPNNTIEHVTQYSEFEDKIKQDEKRLNVDNINQALYILETQFNVYKEICKQLKIKPMEFNKVNIKDNTKYSFIHDLNLPYSNTQLNCVMFGLKRTMLDIMEQIKEPIINLLMIIKLSGKNIYEVMLKELTKHLKDEKQMERRIELNILNKLQNKSIESDIRNLKSLQLKFANDIINIKDFVMKNFDKNINDSIKLKELINMTNSVHFKTNELFTQLKERVDKLEDKMKNIRNIRTNSNLDNVWKKFRQVNARCQGLHNRIIDLEDYLMEQAKHEDNKSMEQTEQENLSEHSSDEYEEIEDSQEESNEISD